jgi:hypothetical protein
MEREFETRFLNSTVRSDFMNVKPSFDLFRQTLTNIVDNLKNEIIDNVSTMDSSGRVIYLRDLRSKFDLDKYTFKAEEESFSFLAEFMVVIKEFFSDVNNFIEDTFDIESFDYHLEPIKKDQSYQRYLILKEFGFIDNLEHRLGKHIPREIARIIGELCGLDDKAVKQLARCHSQYRTGSSNDPIRSEASVRTLETFLSRYGLSSVVVKRTSMDKFFLPP